MTFSATHSPHLPLEQRVRLLEQVVVQANEAVVITEAEPIDPPGPRIVYVNDAFTRLTGYSADEVIGRTPRLFQSERTDRRTLDQIRRSLTAWAPFRGEVLNRHKDGRDAWIDLSIVPVAGEDGWFTHWVAIQRDVTERHRHEEALAESEARLRLALGAAQMGIFDIELPARSLTWSDELYALMGHARALGPIWFGDLPSADSTRDDVARLDALVDRVAADPTVGTQRAQISVIVPTDGPRTFEVTLTGRSGADGATRTVAGTVRDITSLVGAERDRMSSTTRLSAAQRLARLGVWDIDATTGNYSWSAEMFELFGRDPALGVPTPEEYFTVCLPPEDAATVRATLRRVVRTHEAAPVEHRVRRSDGSIGHLLSIAEPADPSEHPVRRVAGVSLDITEQRRQGERLEASNAQLAAAQRLVGVGAWTFESATGRVRWSAEMFSIYGRDIASPPTGVADALANIHDDDRDAVSAGLVATSVEGTPFQTEYRFLRPDGEERVASAFGQAVRDAADRIVAVTGAIVDVTDSRRSQQRLVELKDAAEMAAEAKSQFLAKVSHELRTPMNGVLGTLDLLGETSLTPDQRQLARMAHDSAESLLRLLNDLLDFAKIEAGHLELRDAPFDITATVRGVVDLLEPRARNKALALTANIATDVPPMLDGDQGRLRQVLLNLVGNAIKFTEHGRITITVSRRAAPAGDQLRVEVIDSGIGIPQARRQSLFTPFSQVHDPAVVTEVGAGLGLSICRELVEQMHGRIGVDAARTMGSSFWFEVPLRASAAAAEEGAAGQRLAAVGPSALQGLRVLIAEDHPINREVAQRHIEALGARALLAADGAAAVERYASEAIDLILMDWQMPVMDGLTAARQIRALEAASHRARVPIVAVTANVYEADREATRAAGMDGFVAKPIIRQELEAVLTALVSARPAPPADPAEIFPVSSPSVSTVSAESLPPAEPLAALRRLVHDVANAVQAQDLDWFHRGARLAADEAARASAPEVQDASLALLTHFPRTEDDWDDVVIAVRGVQQAMRVVKARSSTPSV
jgi:PAS domain S-box-containing protein